MLVLLALLAGAARGDVVSPGYRHVEYSYEIVNADAFSHLAIVQWAPFGSSTHVLLDAGASHSVTRHLDGKALFYALPRSALGALAGKNAEQTLALFEHDPRARHAAFELSVVTAVHDKSELRAIHDVLTIEKLDATSFVLVATAVVYRYDDGKEERVPYTAVARPAPLRRGALTPSPSAPDAPAPRPAATAPTVDAPGWYRGSLGVLAGALVLAAIVLVILVRRRRK